MARRKASDKKGTGKKNRAASEEVNNVQADSYSIAFKELHIGGDVGGDIRIGHTIGYTAEQVSVLLKQITTTLEPKKFDGRCPYKGLEVFEEEDAELFFGRERLVNELVGRVKESRTVFITGPSGSGKSSLVRAGLIHALKRGAIKSSDRWLYETMKPGREPLKDLALALSRLKSPELEDYFLAHSTETDILNKCAESVLSGRKDQRFLLFVDQFEEIFTQVNSEQERVAFINMLAHAGTIENGRVIILFAMRSDFVSNCATYPALNELLSQEFRQIGAMQPEELVSAIALPAMHVGLPVENELIAQIINDMRGEPDALPLMQFALKDLFDAKQTASGVIALTLKDYLGHGGIHKSLERHADATFAKLSESEQELTRSIFSGLIEIGRGTQDTKRTALFDELIPANTKPEEVSMIVQKLADARLIITDEQAGKDTVTLAHEKLIDAWPWLKKLVNANRDVIALQNEISSDAKEWEEHQRDESYLYRGTRLANVREKLASQSLILSGLANEFIQTGGEAYTNELEEAKKRADRLLELTNMALARQLAAQAVARLNNQPDLAILLSIEAVQRRDAFETRDSLLTGLLYSPRLITFLHTLERDLRVDGVYSVTISPDGKLLAMGGKEGKIAFWDTGSHRLLDSLSETIQEKLGSRSSVIDLKFSMDGKTLAVLRAFDKLSLFNLDTREISTSHILFEDDRTFDPKMIADRDLCLSQDCKTVAIHTSDNTIIFWNVMNRQETSRLHLPKTSENTNQMFAMGISPNSQMLAISSSANEVTLWDVITLQELGKLQRSEKVSGLSFMKIAFSPDCHKLVASDLLGSVTVWDIPSLREIGSSQQIAFDSPDRLASCLAFNHDGQKIAVTRGKNIDLYYTEASFDNKLLRSMSIPLLGHTSTIRCLIFGPDKHFLVTGGEDGKVVLWDIVGDKEFGIPFIFDDKFSSIVHARDIELSSDGKELITLTNHPQGAPQGIDFWNTTTHKIIASLPIEELLSHITLSPDNKILAAEQSTFESQESAILLLDFETKKIRGSPLRKSGALRDIAFDPSSRILATTYSVKTSDITSEGDLILWDIITGQGKNINISENSTFYGLTFHPSYKVLYLAGSPGIVQWDYGTDQILHAIKGFYSVIAISPDGNILAAAHERTISLWSTANNRSLGNALLGHTGRITSLTFTYDGKMLASGGDDGLRLWDIATQQLMGPPLTTRRVNKVAINRDPESPILVSSGEEIRQWRLDIKSWIDRARQIANRNFTRAEWIRYFPEEEYRKTSERWPLESVVTATSSPTP